MSRKDTLRALLGARERREQADTAPEAVEARPLVRSGAVGAMGRSLGRIAHAAEEARALIAAGDTVVEVDPERIEVSFMADRFTGTAEDHAALVASIREHGQQVPILVRPHPSKAGTYQVAYGHRRLRALREIGRTVRAVVRELSDAELVVAQGQENSARLDLSFIERAYFAAAIEDRGFDRTVIMAALSVEKTQLSRLISIGRAMPHEVVVLIGPAPKTGRPRWEALAALIAGREIGPALAALEADPAFIASGSDTRFAMLFKALKGEGERDEAQTFADEAGKTVASIRKGAGRTTFVVDDRQAPAFADYLIRHLPQLYEHYRKARQDTD